MLHNSWLLLPWSYIEPHFVGANVMPVLIVCMFELSKRLVSFATRMNYLSGYPRRSTLFNSDFLEGS